MKLKLVHKLSLILALTVVATAVAVGIGDFLLGSRALQTQAEQTLRSLTLARKFAIESYFDDVRQDILVNSSNPLIAEALGAFAQAWRQLGDNPGERLQGLYIRQNLFPEGRREDLDAASDDSIYSRVHVRYHSYFQKLREVQKHYDLFLIDPNGNIVYSVVKEADFGTNLAAEVWSDTYLGRVFDAVNKFPTAMAQFSDFQFYGPSAGTVAGFVAASVRSATGQHLGVLACRCQSSAFKAWPN